MIYYLIEIFLWQLAFLLLYGIWIKKETFFQLNRFFLLGSLVLSFILPFVSFDSYLEMNQTVYQNIEPILIKGKNFQQSWSTSSFNSLSYIMAIGSLLLLLFYMYNLFKLYNIYKKGEKRSFKKSILIEIEGINNAFSFFKYIFIEKNLSKEIKEKILTHEMVHVEGKHSLDILFIKIIKIILWYNPLIYLYEKELEENHEYIADNKVIRSYDKKEYLNLLLQIRFQTFHLSFIQAFSHQSLIKKRIKMQNKKSSSKINYIKYTSIFIVIFALSIFFNACKQENIKPQDKSLQNVEVEVVKPNSTEDIEVAYQFLQNPPQIEGCEGLTGKEAKACFSKKIQEIILENFYANLAKKLDPNHKQIKVMTQFTIDKDGKITNIRARSKYADLEKEAKRVIALIPPMKKPGYQNGNPVKVTYTLPILIQLDEK